MFKGVDGFDVKVKSEKPARNAPMSTSDAGISPNRETGRAGQLAKTVILGQVHPVGNRALKERRVLAQHRVING